VIQNIETLPDTRENKVTIFNRWGDLIWEGVNYDNRSVVFTGLNKNGNEVASGTYFYKIEFPNGRETKTGFVTVRR
jgi:gliding motility-associated-like protein